MDSKHDDPLTAPISLIFRWTGSGLDVLHSPGRMDNYPISRILQRSLHRPLHAPPTTPHIVDGRQNIPFGVVANLLHRTEWCNLNLNFEPGEDMKLRVYISVDDFRLPDLSHPVQVILSTNGKEISKDIIQKGSYQSPPLLPGQYRFMIVQEENVLSEIRVVLD
jgi:hypothetical protein